MQQDVQEILSLPLTETMMRSHEAEACMEGNKRALEPNEDEFMDDDGWEQVKNAVPSRMYSGGQEVLGTPYQKPRNAVGMFDRVQKYGTQPLITQLPTCRSRFHRKRTTTPVSGGASYRLLVCGGTFSAVGEPSPSRRSQTRCLSGLDKGTI